MIDITLDHPADSAAALSITDGRAFIDVTDPRGINGLTAVLSAGDWPEEIVVLLRLRGLEHLEISYGDYILTTGRSSNESPNPPVTFSVRDENGDATQLPAPTSANPAIRHTADGFEITLPPHFFEDDYSSFSIQWIDYYR